MIGGTSVRANTKNRSILPSEVKAVAYLERLAPQFDSLSESEQFDFLCAQAFARGRMENFQGGLQAINEALKIFPTNCYANAVKILLETERF